MSEDRLKLNDDKTEFRLDGTKQQLVKVCYESAQYTLIMQLQFWI